MTTIGFATTDVSLSYRTLGGAGHYRIGLPAAALKDHGVEVRIGFCVARKEGPLGLVPWDADGKSPEAMQRMAWWPDVIVLQRYMHKGLAEAIRNARAGGQVVINDVDDLFDAIPPSNRAFRATHPAVHEDINVNYYRQVLAASSAVTVSTPYLRERVSRYCRSPIIVLRNAIDLERWETHAHQEPPRLGWVGVLSHRASDVEQAQIVTQLLGGHYHKQFSHVGAINGIGIAKALRVGEDHVAPHPMVPIEDYPAQFTQLDVGIVPLSSHPFNMAKSCIKGMEYAAAGVPFVASESPEYAWLYTTHGIGRLARRGKDWLRQLKALADPDTRHAEARDQREKVSAMDIRKRWDSWHSVYTSVEA